MVPPALRSAPCTGLSWASLPPPLLYLAPLSPSQDHAATRQMELVCEPCSSSCNTATLFPSEWAQGQLGDISSHARTGCCHYSHRPPPGQQVNKAPLRRRGHRRPRRSAASAAGSGPDPGRSSSLATCGVPRGADSQVPVASQELCSHGNNPETQMDGWSLQTKDGPSATQTAGTGLSWLCPDCCKAGSGRRSWSSKSLELGDEPLNLEMFGSTAWSHHQASAMSSRPSSILHPPSVCPPSLHPPSSVPASWGAASALLGRAGGGGGSGLMGGEEGAGQHGQVTRPGQPGRGTNCPAGSSQRRGSEGKAPAVVFPRRQRFSGRWALTHRRRLGVSGAQQIGSRDGGDQSRLTEPAPPRLSRGCQTAGEGAVGTLSGLWGDGQ